MYFEDFELGMSVETAPAFIDKEKMLDFARLYDNLPLHMDEEYGKKTVFGGMIAPGVMTFMSVWVKFLELNLFGDEIVAGKSTKIEWLKPVYPNDTLVGKVSVTRLEKRNAYNGIVEVFVEAFNQHGELVLTDYTEFIIKCRPSE